MKNNKGFIAISLIYSFFLIFLITLLAIVNSYVHNRVLLNNVKKETQSYLENITLFVNNELASNNYNPGDIIEQWEEEWVVLTNDENSVEVILNRNLTSEEINNANNSLGIPTNAFNGEKTLMCLNNYGSNYCSRTRNYYWNISVVKNILDRWYENKISFRGLETNLLTMSYSDILRDYTGFIRIPMESDYDLIPTDFRDDIWYMTSNSDNKIQIGDNEVYTYEEEKTIRPIIKFRKAN